MPLDLAEAERLFAAIPDQSLAPDAAYDREWALSLLDAAIEELGREHASKRSDIPFAILRPFLTSRAGVPRPYEELSAACSVPVGTLKNLVHRLRERLPDALMQQVRATMDNPAMEEVRAELRILADYL